MSLTMADRRVLRGLSLTELHMVFDKVYWKVTGAHKANYGDLPSKFEEKWTEIAHFRILYVTPTVSYYVDTGLMDLCKQSGLLEKTLQYMKRTWPQAFQMVKPSDAYPYDFYF